MGRATVRKSEDRRKKQTEREGEDRRAVEERLDAFDAAVRGGEGPRTSVRYRLRKGDGDGLLRSSRQGLHRQIITHEPLADHYGTENNYM